MFPKCFFKDPSKGVIVWEWVKDTTYFRKRWLIKELQDITLELNLFGVVSYGYQHCFPFPTIYPKVIFLYRVTKI